MTDTQERLYTADDLFHMPTDGKHYELIRGELIEMAPTNGSHGVLTFEFAALLRNHIRAHKQGQGFGAETGFKLSENPDTILAPDVAYISAEHAKPLTDKFVDGAPDLAIEVVSPGNSANEINEKTALYFHAGTRQVWIVYPNTRTIYVYTSATKVTILSGADILDGSDVLPGFRLPLTDLFGVLDS
jgi:Uma2 family endonuclease